ncbi:uncharacterized protein (TIGR03086 family) [Actinoplanes lutulentus]|uniref:Uncharacterized protein (TIGR03086 family) n=1 Tax=Actinoplanes lutulentus TaxID=1287878 RepID=A0A327Z4U8_9ACTN|nr:TIGR03086 family metal-binding protein [Actinoplanes lutulentus]MBB2948256.1 uncharacterized protein (TIGR03086 family) [Actinoplanes lutulentus]RAK31246.1 uncharacterized protein (TIGR03086 family) [Actinoplanes lutulentus]
MSTEISELLGIAAPATIGAVQGVRDDQLDAPTPCTEFQVRNLVNHLLQVAVNFQDLAHKKDVDWTAGGDRLTGDWRASFAADVRDVRAAWADPAVLDGVSPGMGLPQRTLGLMLTIDLLVHGWDVATATGQPYSAPPQLVAAGHEFLDTMLDMGRKMGAFGPEAEAPADADELERLIARTGRDPRWSAA